MYANSIFFLCRQFSERKIYKKSPKIGEFWKRMFNFVEIYIKMAANLQQRIESLRSKSRLLTERYAEVLEEKRAAEAQIDELRAQLQRQQREISHLRQQIENLQVVTTISHNRKDVERSRAFLSQLVRDIDKCIAELTD